MIFVLQQLQLREQQEMLRAFQEKHQQEQQLKNSKSLNLKWADPVGKNQSTRVKSLAEIQAEEHERMAKVGVRQVHLFDTICVIILT